MKLDILHTNDIHSCIDNFAKMGSYINKVRLSNPHNLLVDSGDMITGDFQFKYNMGAAEREINNYLKYDAVTIGNHDLDNGKDFLKEHMNQIDAPYVLTNVIDNYNEIGDYTTSLIKQVGEVAVGFISFINPRIVYSIGEDIHFDYLDPSLYQAEIDKLRSQGVDVVVALNHQGIDEDIKLANDTLGIDVIIGAHSHTTLKQPEVVNGTIIVQTGSFGANLGHLELDIDNNQISGFKYNLVVVDTITEVDEELQAIVDKYNANADKHCEIIFGSCQHHLEGRREYMTRASTNLGSLICDSYLDYAKSVGYAPDFAMINARGLRQSIPPGNITTRSLYNVMPFEKQLLIIDIKGRDLLEALDNPIELQTANLMIHTKGDGSREVYDRYKDNQIELDRIYQVATMNYIYEHHLFTSLTNSELIAKELASDIEIVSTYIQKLGHGFTYESNKMVSCEKK
ncbi:bifunctional UDP-sugar hydrolase/5'-nucleotidase [Mollicutes bacterium LVI A0039]|nr:bifunctional UDP-sugar hydrolase/5'-nucleotidase [Mollicutes bacterium LVI A0039]